MLNEVAKKGREQRRLLINFNPYGNTPLVASTSGCPLTELEKTPLTSLVHVCIHGAAWFAAFYSLKPPLSGRQIVCFPCASPTGVAYVSFNRSISTLGTQHETHS